MVKRSSGKWSSRFSLPGSVMLTRRTATVMISAPAASVARRVSSNERYLPLPTMSRERYSRPATTKGSTLVMMDSTASDELDDLDGVAVAERGGRVIRARNDGAVHLDGDAPRPERERRDHTRRGGSVRELAGLGVHRHLHASRRYRPRPRVTTRARVAHCPAVARCVQFAA